MSCGAPHSHYTNMDCSFTMNEGKSNVEDEWVGGGNASGRCQLAKQFLDIKDNEKPVKT